jgi:hypothetical protein
VVVVEDLPELAVELDGDALAQFAGADHVVRGLLWGGGGGAVGRAGARLSFRGGSGL